jgi:hypothetical protein
VAAAEAARGFKVAAVVAQEFKEVEVEAEQEYKVPAERGCRVAALKARHEPAPAAQRAFRVAAERPFVRPRATPVCVRPPRARRPALGQIADRSGPMAAPMFAAVLMHAQARAVIFALLAPAPMPGRVLPQARWMMCSAADALQALRGRLIAWARLPAGPMTAHARLSGACPPMTAILVPEREPTWMVVLEPTWTVGPGLTGGPMPMRAVLEPTWMAGRGRMPTVGLDSMPITGRRVWTLTAGRGRMPTRELPREPNVMPACRRTGRSAPGPM